MKYSLLETHLSGFLAPSLMSADLLPEHPMINCKKKKNHFHVNPHKCDIYQKHCQIVFQSLSLVHSYIPHVPPENVLQ